MKIGSAKIFQYRYPKKDFISYLKDHHLENYTGKEKKNPQNEAKG